MPPAPNTAAAPGALRFEQTHPIAGVTPGIAQPSVMLIVHADASKLPADFVERLDALLRPLAGAMPRPSRESGGSPLGSGAPSGSTPSVSVSPVVPLTRSIAELTVSRWAPACHREIGRVADTSSRCRATTRSPGK